MRHAVFSILVENSAGVLSRVAGLFSRRGYNIDSLTVGETTDPKVSRMTVTVTGDDDVLEQIEKQLSKLIDVKEVVELPAEASVCRELVLVKVECDTTRRQEIIAISDIFRANIVDVSTESVIIELTGAQSKLNAFIELLNGFKITELARTGITGLARGAASLK
ncbi:MAG: acetolactate synthase small subunit [Lachnospira sp.]|jgi:acetolactate synthase-1/3 small subunit|nr:acetolactate synthase small subunit [Lachnospira sp.]